MKRLDDLTADTKVDWSKFSVEKFYATLFKIIEQRENVEITYSLKKRTPEERAAEAKKREPFENCMEEVLGILTDQELHVLGLRFGYNNSSYSRKEVGVKMGLTSSEVGKVEKTALEKLRAPEQIQKMHPFLCQVIKEERSFYVELFTKVFKLKKEHIQHILNSEPPAEAD